MMCCVCAEPSSSKCGQCSDRPYCSRKCQRQDWKSHKSVCAKPVFLCKLCLLERGPNTTVVLDCGHAFHGACLAQLRDHGSCLCGEELPETPADLYKQAMEKLLDPKEALSDHVLQLLKEAAVQGHPLAQLRTSDILAEKEEWIQSEYWLRKAAEDGSIVGINARLKLGILVMKRDLDEAERLFYEGRAFFEALGVQKHPAIKNIHAQLCFYTAVVAVAKDLPENATYYYQKAVELHSCAAYLEAHGAHLVKLKKYAEAEPVLRACSKKNPKSASVVWLLGVCAANQGRSADPFLKRALKLDPFYRV